MATEYYRKLCERFEKLQNAFLPDEFSPTGEYEDIVYEHTRAYKVLTHAELEYYFEEAAKAIAQKALREWRSSNQVSKPLLALVAYYPGAFEPLPELSNGNHVRMDLEQRISDSCTEYFRYVRSENHGIKERNLIHLFLPIGIKIDELPHDVLISANNYGVMRGAIAHSTRAQQMLQPEEVKRAADEILENVALLDDLLEPYLLPPVPPAETAGESE